MNYNYDVQIASLTKNPALIERQWSEAEGLFKCIGGMAHPEAGCLTMIRNSQDGKHWLGRMAVINGVVDDKLTQEIREDERIPTKCADIKVEHLPIFKEWQERIDKLQNS